MICPFCSQEIQEMWQQFYTTTDEFGVALQEPRRWAETITKPRKRVASYIKIRVYWMKCPNPRCREVIARVHKSVTNASKTTAEPEYLERLPSEESFWFAVPQRKASPAISSLVPENLARDYREAYLILDDSPRMSAILSRRVLADLLKQYAGLAQHALSARIDAFVRDGSHPVRHRNNLHYLREIGNFSAHTMTDTEGNIVDVGEAEARWTLRVVLALFEYFIVDPHEDARIRSEMDEKIRRAGRKPIRKPEGGKVTGKEPS